MQQVIRSTESRSGPRFARSQPVGRPWMPTRYSSSSTGSSSPGAGPSRPSRRRLYLLAIPLALLPFTLFGSSRKPLDPYTYSDHEVRSSTRLTPQHAQLAIPLLPTDAAKWRRPEPQSDKDEVISIRHVMVKNPDLQIERPYTPVNDVGKDGDIKLVVKRVKGGEVGRCATRLLCKRYDAKHVQYGTQPESRQ